MQVLTASTSKPDKEAEFQFYPTPPSLVRQLVSPYYSMTCRALEPSAGRGDILDALPKSGGGYYRMEVECCEISPDLRAILISKGYKVIGTDFLRMQAPYLYGLVVMNPPFATCAEHVLKAWDMLLPEGKLGAILPKTAIGKDTGKFAELNQIINLFGKVEEIGKAFSGAERKTDVECVIVRLEKPARQKFQAFEGFNPQMEEDYTAPQERNLPAPRNMIKSIVAQYQAAMKALRVAYESEQYYRSLAPESLFKYESEKKTYSQRIDETKTAFWDLIFEKTRIGEVTTSGYRKEFMEARARLSQMEFSEETIYEVLHHFMQNKEAILEECVKDVFKGVTRYSRDNVTKKEAWATNKGWKITPKVIIPNCLGYYSVWSMRPEARDFLNDLDKVLTMFGSANGNCTVQGIEDFFTRLRNREVTDYTGKHETPNFHFRAYKKGTVHLYFKDLKTLEMINKYMADHEMPVLGSGR